MNRRRFLEPVLSAELDKAVSKLLAPRSTGLVVSGGFGSGKHEFAASVLDRIANQTTVVHLHCDRLTAKVPLAALTPLLNERTDRSSMMEVYRDLRGELAQAPGFVDSGVPTVVGIDQSAFLDQETSFVLAQLVHSGVIRLLVVTDLDSLSTDALEPIVALGSLHSHEMEGFSATQCAAIASDLLACRLSAGSLGKLMQLTAGIPELVGYVLAVAEEHRAISVVAGFCRIDWDGVLNEEQLHDLVLSLVRSLPDRSRTVVEMTCLGGEIDSSVVEQVMDGPIDDLVSSGLIASGPNGTVWAGAELVRHVVTRCTGPGRARHLMQIHRECSEPIFTDDRNVHWALRSGVQMKKSVAVNAARRANKRGAHDTAHDIASFNLSGHASFEQQIELHTAEAGRGRFITALRGLETLGESVADLASLDILSKAWLLQLHMSSAAGESYARAAEKWRKILGRLRETENSAIAERIEFCRIASRTTSTKQLARDAFLMARQSQTPDVRLLALTVGHENLTSVRIDDKASVPDIWNFFAGQPRLVVGRAMAALLNRAMCTSDVAFIAHVKEAIDVEHGTEFEELEGLPGLLDGWLLWRAGNYGAAEHVLAQAVSDFTEAGKEIYATLAVPFLMMMDSNSVLPPNLLLRSRGASHPFVTSVTHPVNEVSILLADSSVTECTVRSLISMAQETGNELQEMMIYWNMLFGSHSFGLQVLATSATRISDLSKASGNPELGEFSTLVDALCAGPDACTKLISSSTKWSWVLLPSFAAAQVLNNESEEDEHRSLALNWLYSHGRAALSKQPKFIGSSLRLHGLTEREHEIVRQVVSGGSNRQIATNLTLSVRTIEGHIYRIFGKLGVADRNELKQLSGAIL